MKLDLKSVLIGALSVVCFVLITGAKDSNQGEVGRYQISSTNGPIELIYESIIDTQTGRVFARYRLGYNSFK